ncbi:MAG TPA: hypothetical protein VGS41_14585 [Chthonomonadales bacterium]|nr:hypothetical protein [Chthonomonadales bacterium]
MTINRRFLLPAMFALALWQLAFAAASCAGADQPGDFRTGTSKKVVAGRYLGTLPPNSVLAGQQLAAADLALPDLNALLYSPLAAGRKQVGALSPFPLYLRLGLMFSPRTKFDGGVDLTLSGLHLTPDLSSRIDADVIVSANFGGISTLIPITFDQIYSHGLVTGNQLYIGGGIGPYIGKVTRFGGKLLAGVNFTSRLGAEVDVHFPGWGDPLVTAQVRLGL